jgi:hypothetical protein
VFSQIYSLSNLFSFSTTRLILLLLLSNLVDIFSYSGITNEQLLAAIKEENSQLHAAIKEEKADASDLNFSPLLIFNRCGRKSCGSIFCNLFGVGVYQNRPCQMDWIRNCSLLSNHPLPHLLESCRKSLDRLMWKRCLECNRGLWISGLLSLQLQAILNGCCRSQGIGRQRIRNCKGQLFASWRGAIGRVNRKHQLTIRK